jgi:2,3-bisphosphoglycerate-independent phosphoglycerate mutase
MSILMVFIDGFGLGSKDAGINPFMTADMPFMKKLLDGKFLTGADIGTGIARSGLTVKPTDATLGVAGIPQSATGQTVLFTGINAAQLAGRHVNGFPTKFLREILHRNNLFKIINRCGKRAVFANTFTSEYFEAVERGKWRHSVTTTAALAGGCRLLMLPDLLSGQAVFQDITNEILRERGYDVPLLKPETAAGYLLNQAVRNDFTLFEYFQTDHCGHAQDWDLALILLNRLDVFLGVLAERLAELNLTLLIVSDHGNIEDLSIKTHTFNPVPTIAIGTEAQRFAKVSSLLDIYPIILEYLGLKGVLDDNFGPENCTAGTAGAGG